MTLAALHYNENVGRAQAQTQQGREQYKISFPKFKRGEHIVRRVLEDPAYGMLCESALTHLSLD